MCKINYILISENGNHKPNDPRLHDLRHYHIVKGNPSNEASRIKLIEQLVQLRRHHPDAQILSLSEIDGHHIYPSEAMNQLRRELSDHS